MRTHLGQFEHPAGRADGPAGLDGLVDQVEQADLGGRIDAPRDPAT
ncbi:MAG: hypothetical protein ACRDQA_13850 [Nocardioidaceae bacterium]